MVIKPFAFDQNAAVAMADDAMKRGSEIAIEHALGMECLDSTCQTIKTAALVTSLTSISDKPTAVVVLNEDIAPIPPIRPARFN